MTEALVKTESLYAALFDLASPANTPETFGTTLQTADARAKESNEPWAALWHFNSALNSLARQGSLMAWTVLFDGVFKVVVEVLPPTNDTFLEDQEAGNLSNDSRRLLWCPSGNITVACLGALGDSDLAPIVVVEPGTYRATLKRDTAEEDKHSFLETLSDYPPADGPDWHIQLQLQNINTA